MKVNVGIKRKPYRITLYGPPGIGKSETAGSATKPIYANIEDALHHIDCHSTDLIENPDMLTHALREIAFGKFKGEYKTIIIDTIDALEDLIIKDLCSKNSMPSLAAFGFGKGFDLLNKKWTEILDMLDKVVRLADMNIILIGHDQIKRFEDPLGDGWDRYFLKMHPKSALTLTSRMDAVLYMSWDKLIRKTESGIRKAVGTGERIIYSQETPAFSAKNRYGLQPKINNVGRDFFKHFEQTLYPQEILEERTIEKIEE